MMGRSGSFPGCAVVLLLSLAGCDEYLTKPVDENRLLEVVAKFLPAARAAA